MAKLHSQECPKVKTQELEVEEFWGGNFHIKWEYHRFMPMRYIVSLFVE